MAFIISMCKVRYAQRSAMRRASSRCPVLGFQGLGLEPVGCLATNGLAMVVIVFVVVVSSKRTLSLGLQTGDV